MSKHPAPGHVAIWWMDLRALPEGAETRWLHLLDENEQAKANRFHFAADRRQYIAAHGLARTMLATHLGTRPETLRFFRTPKGRPELAGETSLRFSLSHTRTLVACAVANGDAVGLDVEASDRAVAAQDIAQSYFAPAEARLVRERGREAFLRLWTLKEAFLKATGDGLSRRLDSFSFSLDPIRIDDCEGDGNWRFAQFSPLADHLLAVALQGTGSGPAQIAPREILADAL